MILKQFLLKIEQQFDIIDFMWKKFLLNHPLKVHGNLKPQSKRYFGGHILNEG